MSNFLVSSTTGWFAAFLIAGTLALPYVIRSQLAVAKDADMAGPYGQRMRAHVWIGFVIVALVLVHMWVSMGTGMTTGSGPVGMVIETAVLLIVIIQAISGSSLRKAAGAGRGSTRAFHFTAMIVIVGLTVVHAWMTSPIFSGLR